MEGNDIKYTYFFRKIEVEGTTNGGGRISLITKLVEDTVRNLQVNTLDEDRSPNPYQIICKSDTTRYKKSNASQANMAYPSNIKLV